MEKSHKCQMIQNQTTSICHAGCVGYADDLDRFIEGQIGFEEIQGCIPSGITIEGAIISVLNAKYHPKEEHDLYEKLCYAEVLHCMQYYDRSELYATYLFAKDICSPHKLDWGGLLTKIKSESGINDTDIARGTNMYKECQRKGGYHSDLLPVENYED